MDENAYDYDEVPFDDDFEGSYIVEGITYDVSIKGIHGDDTGKNNYYTASYSDGSSKDIDYQAGTGWIERGAGQTPHALAIGKLIEKHFS